MTATQKLTCSTASSTDDTFPNGSSGYNALSAPSDPDPWGSRSGPWNNTEPPRNTSGNTSPNRTRDGAIHELPNTSPYYTSAQPQMQPAIGQRGNMTSRAKPGSALDSSTATFKYGPFPDYGDEKENSRPFPSAKFEVDPAIRGFRSDKRGSQDNSYLNVFGAPSRDSGIPQPGHSDTDQHTQGNAYGDFTYNGPASNTVHSKRPSIAGLSGSFSGQPTNARSFMTNQMDDEELQHKFTRNLSLNDGSNGPQNGLGNGSTYGSGTSQTFQFNPVSQPWDNGKGYGNGGAQPQDAYPDPLAGPYANTRGGTADRESPAGSAYRPGIGSPKSYGGTPQPGIDPWSRPASRDPRMAPDIDRRSQGQHFLQQQQQQQQQAPQYYAHPFYAPNYQQQFPPHPYDPYAAAAQPNFRPPMPLPAYGLPMNTYLGAAGIPLRPNSKDLDPAKGVRSPLLEDFRSSSKSNKRYDLKVWRCYPMVTVFTLD